MTIKDRIFAFLEHEEISKARFFEKTGLKSSNFKGAALQSDLGSDKVAKILTSYPQLSSDWLLMGYGEMLRDRDNVASATQIHFPKGVERKHDLQAINVYDLQASAGIQEILDNGGEQPIDTLYISNMPACDGAVSITGDSMRPILCPEDLILFKGVPCEEQQIFYNQMYLVSFALDSEFYTVCKYIRKSPKGFPYIILASENPDFPDKEIHFGCVKAMALVKAFVRYGGVS